MAVQHISNDSLPHYLALSTDIEDDTLDGASYVGKIVYLTDTNQWKIITGDLTLADYVFP